MLTKRLITLEEYDQHDPTGKGREHIQSLQGSPYREPSNPYIKDRGLDAYLAVVDHQLQVYKHVGGQWASYAEWVAPTKAKIAPQGGRYEFSHLLQYLEEYYKLPTFNTSEILSLGLQYMIKCIQDFYYRNPAEVPVDFVYEGCTGASAGLYTMSHKGQYSAETSFCGQFRHLEDNIPGERILKGKERVIFMDSVSNVRLVEKLLAKCKYQLKKIFPYFTSWQNPDLGMREQITKALVRRYINVETDQTAMDRHFTMPVVEHYILPLYEHLLSPGEFNILAQYCSEAFTQPLFMGTERWLGEHSLFSGQPITNDFETVIHVMGYLGSILQMYRPGLPRAFELLANGDDVGLLIREQGNVVVANLLPIIREAFTTVGFEFSLEKERVNTGNLAFCKKLYSVVLPKTPFGTIGGAYSPYYAINSIYYPERSAPTRGQAAVAALQILDNLSYTPAVTPIYQWMIKWTTFDWNFSQADIDAVTARDWWFRVYGEKWKPTSSVSFNRIMDLLI